MTGEAKPPVLTARRATQHIRLSEADDAYEHLCILTNATKPSPFSALCSQIHRRLAVLVPSSHLWVHCPRASNGLLPRRSNLVGYAQWDARSDQFPPCQTIISNSFTGRSLLCFLHRFHKRSRVQAPAKSQLRFRRGDVVPNRRRNLYLRYYRAAFASFRAPIPTSPLSASRLPTPRLWGTIRVYSVPLIGHVR
jgi:hypothetical protein